MIINSYSPVHTLTTNSMFFDYIDLIDIPEIDYFAVGIQNLATKKSTSIMSLPEWQRFFVHNNFADYDPLRRASLFTKRNLIPMTEIDYIDNFGKEIMRQRALMGIRNGIVLMERLPWHNYMITLGTGYRKFDPFDFIKRYHDKICFLKADLINLMKKEASLFLPANIIHLSSDAK